MRDELPKEKMGSAVALMSATLGIGSAMGLPLAGVLYESLGWASIFWVSAAAGTLLLLAVVLVVPESKVRTPGRFDYAGALVLSAALAIVAAGHFQGRHLGLGLRAGPPAVPRPPRYCWPSGCPTSSGSASRWSTCGPRPAGPC